ncbi:MAG: ricin-type beta-trefoil lectin domain protein, partial [Saprospiraceae bacterium]|nr:ricin-type beta-trefoil lectin domain protein [Saprospiraceae bacterium]
MKKSAVKIKFIAMLALFLLAIVLPKIKAQTYYNNSGQLLADGYRYTVPYQNKSYLDLTIPPSTEGQYLYLRLEGADGGRFRRSTSHKWSPGGEGATVVLVVEIGSGLGQVPVGSTLRFIAGEKGGENSTSGTDYHGAGSGGGTGLAFKGPGQNDKWQLLAVAGAGSGGLGNCCTWEIAGKPGGGIVATQPSLSTGVGGNVLNSYWAAKVDLSGAGGGAFSQGESMTAGAWPTAHGGSPGWPGGPDNGAPTGGNGGENSGWGFGGGGSTPQALTYRTGGGGGYSGGDVPDALVENGGEVITGKGGGSFYHATYAKIGYAVVHGTTTSSGDGFINYQFIDGPLFKSIRFAYNTNKCIDDYGSRTANGNNILSYTCTGNSNQQWLINSEDRTIRSKLNLDKCLDLSGGNTSNGANIQLWDCTSGNDNQHWVYNGLFKTIHSSVNSGKCFDAANGSASTNNVNLQLWECNYSSNNMKWVIDGATTVSNPANVKHIIPVLAPNFAVASALGNVWGSN